MPRIVIVEPDPRWPMEFQQIAAELADVLAGTGASAIDHIGSTAVPGLVAKDVIDVQVSVMDVRDGRLRERMEPAGFAWWPDIAADHCPPGADVAAAQLEKAFASQGDGMRRTNIHFRVPGRFNHRYALLCRDHLRTHPGAAAAYGEVKRNLARLFPDDVESYYDVKDPVFDLIMAGAEDWAATAGWHPGRHPG